MRRHADAVETVPEPRIIAGVVMRPFCLGHHLLLRAFGLPFAGSPEADAGPDDVFIGIAVCGMSYEGASEAIRGGTFNGEVAAWRRKLAGPWWNPRMLDYDAIEAAFRDYLADGYKMPPVWTYDGAGIALSAPWEVMLKTRLHQAGLAETEILNGYLPARWYEYFAAAEMEAMARCDDPKAWRKLFFTKSDAEKLETT